MHKFSVGQIVFVKLDRRIGEVDFGDRRAPIGGGECFRGPDGHDPPSGFWKIAGLIEGNEGESEYRIEGKDGKQYTVKESQLTNIDPLPRKAGIEKTCYQLPDDGIWLSQAMAAVRAHKIPNLNALQEAWNGINLLASKREVEQRESEGTDWEKACLDADLYFCAALVNGELQAFVLNDFREWVTLPAEGWRDGLNQGFDLNSDNNFVGPPDTHLLQSGPDTRLRNSSQPTANRSVFLRRSEFERWLSPRSASELGKKNKGTKPGPRLGSGEKFKAAIKKIRELISAETIAARQANLKQLENKKLEDRTRLIGAKRDVAGRALAAVRAELIPDK